MSAGLACYSVRQLSPFIGNIQIIEADYCRALSSDGQAWQIQASCETHQQVWNISNDEYVPRRYVLYGSWSRQQGFSSLPLDPMLDVPALSHVKHQLIDHMEHCCQRLPFVPRDHYEYWLIDEQSQRPLALTASTTEQRIIPHIRPARWQGLSRQDESAIAAMSLERLGSLEQQVNLQGRSGQWFQRHHDGRIEALDSSLGNYAQQDFPPYLVEPDLLPADHQATCRQLIDWQSPRLLTLPWIDTSSRQQLAELARHHALETRRRWALYPVPLAQDIINKIQVELKIRGL